MPYNLAKPDLDQRGSGNKAVVGYWGYLTTQQ